MNRFIITFGAAAACLLGGVQSALAKETVDPAKQAALRANIVKFAQSKMGTKVGERGECTDLVDAALKQCGGKPAFNSQTSVTEDGKVSIVPT